MVEPTILEHVPLWGFLVATLVITVLTDECGYRLGRRQDASGDNTEKKSEGVAAVVGATLALLAFLVAFTFGLAAQRYDSRREALQAEVNAVRAAFLRTELMPEPQSTALRKSLREYVKVRIDAYDSPTTLRVAIGQSRKLQKDMWKDASEVGRDVSQNRGKAPNSDMVALFIGALSEVNAAHANRVGAVVQARVPAAIWASLVVIALIGFFSMGYNQGMRGGGRTVVGIGMILCFAITLYLIADLDRPLEGFIRVNPQAMLELQEFVNEQQP